MNRAEHASATGAPPQGGAPVCHGTPLRIVFDTNVLLSMYVFADSRFAPFRQRVDDGQWTALTSVACLDEFTRVLGYPEFRLDDAARERALAAYAARAVSIGIDPAPMVSLPRCQDRDDQKFLDLARDGGADWLLTADKAVLKLARRDALRGLFRILTPEAALALL